MEKKLTILWTNSDPLTAKFMVFMYAENSLIRDWWDQVEIIVWGGSAKLVVEDKSVQEKLLDIKRKGVKVGFCIACVRELGISDQIEALGFEIKSMGDPLTQAIKNGNKIITI